MLGVSWNWVLYWQPFRRHPANICILLLEWDFWVGASSLPQGRRSWHNLLICCSPSAAVTALYRPSPEWLCYFFPFSSLAIALAQAWTSVQQLDISVQPNATVWLMSAGIASFPFLTSTALDHAYDDLSAPQVSFLLKTPRNCKTTEVLFSHVSPVYRKSESSRLRPGIWYVCAASLNCKKDLQLYFYLSCHRHHPWLSGDLGFISEMTQTDAQSLQIGFNKQYSLTVYVILQIMCSNCVTPIEPHFKFTCTSWTQEQALTLSWSNLLSN